MKPVEIQICKYVHSEPLSKSKVKREEGEEGRGRKGRGKRGEKERRRGS